MDFFDKFCGGDTYKAEEAEVKLDLSGIEKDIALQRLDKTIKNCKLSKVSSIYISFDPAKPGGGETLFQPVMRYLKVEKWNDYVSHAVPLMTEEKGGVFAVFKI